MTQCNVSVDVGVDGSGNVHNEYGINSGDVKMVMAVAMSMMETR